MQFIHDRAADHGALDLASALLGNRGLDAVGDLLDGLHRDRTLLARLLETGNYFRAIERLAPVVFLDHHRRGFFDPLVSRKAPLARRAHPAPTDRRAVTAQPRVHHAVAAMAAIRASHEVSLARQLWPAKPRRTRLVEGSRMRLEFTARRPPIRPSGSASRRRSQAWESGGALRRSGLVRFDVSDDILDGADFLGVFVRNLHPVLLFQGHHQFDDIERISAEVLDK